jgi:hypothetical protein
MTRNLFDVIYLYSYRVFVVTARSAPWARNSATYMVALIPLMHLLGVAYLVEVIFQIPIFESLGKFGVVALFFVAIGLSFFRYQTDDTAFSL